MLDINAVMMGRERLIFCVPYAASTLGKGVIRSDLILQTASLQQRLHVCFKGTLHSAWREDQGHSQMSEETRCSSDLQLWWAAHFHSPCSGICMFPLLEV